MHGDDDQADALGQVPARVEVRDVHGFVVVRVGPDLVDLEAVVVVLFDELERGEAVERGVVGVAPDLQNDVVRLDGPGDSVPGQGDEAVRFDPGDAGLVKRREARVPALQDVGDPAIVREAVPAVADQQATRPLCGPEFAWPVRRTQRR